jgi:hypothetical protein
MRSAKKAGITCMLILLGGLLIISPGCLTTRCPEMPTKPTKPTIQVQPLPDGGISLDRENATKLGSYILDLESGYDP